MHGGILMMRVATRECRKNSSYIIYISVFYTQLEQAVGTYSSTIEDYIIWNIKI
jgi:hypothetical protein